MSDKTRPPFIVMQVREMDSQIGKARTETRVQKRAERTCSSVPWM